MRSIVPTVLILKPRPEERALQVIAETPYNAPQEPIVLPVGQRDGSDQLRANMISTIGLTMQMRKHKGSSLFTIPKPYRFWSSYRLQPGECVSVKKHSKRITYGRRWIRGGFIVSLERLKQYPYPVWGYEADLLGCDGRLAIFREVTGN